jgi:hypothetical protein
MKCPPLLLKRNWPFWLFVQVEQACTLILVVVVLAGALKQRPESLSHKAPSQGRFQRRQKLSKYISHTAAPASLWRKTREETVKKAGADLCGRQLNIGALLCSQDISTTGLEEREGRSQFIQD